MQYFDYICIAVCGLHFIISLVQGFISRKRFKTLCTKCFQPVFEGEEHVCPFNDAEMETIKKFLTYLEAKK